VPDRPPITGSGRHVAGAWALSGALLLQGCATSPDPAEGGFISGVSGLSSGAYKQRVQDRSAELERLRREQSEAEASAAAATATLSRRRAEVQTLKTEIARLDQAIAADQARAASRRAGNAEIAARNRMLQDDLGKARSQLGTLQARLGSGISDAEYAAVQRQYLSLQSAIEAMQKQLYGGR